MLVCAIVVIVCQHYRLGVNCDSSDDNSKLCMMLGVVLFFYVVASFS